MGLYIEYEGDVSFAFLNRLRFRCFGIQHVKESVKHLVHGQEGQSHLTGGFQKFPAVDPQFAA